jgi:hypothetical protein
MEWMSPEQIASALVNNIPMVVAVALGWANLKNKADENYRNIKQIKEHLGLGDKPNGGFARKSDLNHVLVQFSDRSKEVDRRLDEINDRINRRAT